MVSGAGRDNSSPENVIRCVRKREGEGPQSAVVILPPSTKRNERSRLRDEIPALIYLRRAPPSRDQHPKAFETHGFRMCRLAKVVDLGGCLTKSFEGVRCHIGVEQQVGYIGFLASTGGN